MAAIKTARVGAEIVICRRSVVGLVAVKETMGLAVPNGLLSPPDNGRSGSGDNLAGRGFQVGALVLLPRR